MTVTVARRQVDKDALDGLLRTTDDVASVFAGPAPEVANEYQLEWHTRWHPIAEALRDAGAQVATIKRLEEAVSSVSSARAASGVTETAAFASGDTLLGVFAAPGARWAGSAQVTSPAHVLPLLRWMQERPSYVAVVIDRTGADIEECAGAGGSSYLTTVPGPDDEIERNAPGGWEGLAQGRYQRRAEDSWRHNAGAVADHVVAAVERVGARVLVISGDVRAVQLLRERLPERVSRGVAIEQIKGSRAADGSQRRRAEAVAQVVRAAAAEDIAGVLRTFEEERAPGGLAVEGATATLQALACGAVRTLLVVPPGEGDDLMAWFGAHATDVMADETRPDWVGPRRGPLADVAVRSALLSGAEVRVTDRDAGLVDGLGGLRRFR